MPCGAIASDGIFDYPGCGRVQQSKLGSNTGHVEEVREDPKTSTTVFCSRTGLVFFLDEVETL